MLMVICCNFAQPRGFSALFLRGGLRMCGACTKGLVNYAKSAAVSDIRVVWATGDVLQTISRPQTNK